MPRGEAFEQAEASTELGRMVREAGLSVMTCAGYALQAILQSPRPGWQDLLDATDLFLDGPTSAT